MTTLFFLTEAAETDLRGIIRYTRAQWGADQARVYAGKLASGFERLAKGSAAVRDMDDLFPGLRMLVAITIISSDCQGPTRLR